MLKRVYLEITNVCNLACAFCPGTTRTPHFLSEEEFDRLTDALRGETQYLYFHLMGEPLLHPLLGRFLQRAGEKGFRVILTTNGTLLGEKGEVLLSAPALYKINLSLQSFEANRGGELKSYVNRCAAFAAKAGAAGKICELRLWNHGGLESLNGEILSLLSLEFPQPWETNARSVRLAERVYCDGTVVPCCLDHNGDVPLGNLFLQDLKEIMSTDKARRIYDGFSQRKAAEELCRRCGYARRFT